MARLATPRLQVMASGPPGEAIGSLLTAAKLDVARLKSKIDTSTPDVSERITHLIETLNSGIALKRRIIEDLRPSSLSNLGLTTALEFLMSAEIAKTFLLQNLESVVPLAATFALRALMSMLLHWEMEGGHRPANAKEKNKSEPPKDGKNG